MCPFSGQLIKCRWREIFREKNVNDKGQGWISSFISVCFVSLTVPTGDLTFYKMLNCTINTLAAKHTERFVLSLMRLKRGPAEVSVFWVARDDSGPLGRPFTNALVDLSRILRSLS